MKKGVGGNTAEGGAERTQEKEKRKKEKEEEEEENPRRG